MERRRCFRSSVKSLGTNLAETRCIHKSSVKIVWHEPMDAATSCATYRAVSRRFSRMSFTRAVRVSVLEAGSRQHRSSTSVEVRPFSNRLDRSYCRRLTQSVINVSLTQHAVGVCCCFTQFETKFNANSLLLYRLHTKTRQNGTKPVIKAK
jgi:hypothetical protein